MIAPELPITHASSFTKPLTGHRLDAGVGAGISWERRRMGNARGLGR